MRRKITLIAVSVVAAIAAVVGVVSAGDPDNPPGPPETTSSYTLEDIYQRLTTGAPVTKSVFTEPSEGPLTGTMHTLDEIMAVIPYGGCRCEGTLNGTRWCDNLDGTITDLTTCLVWLKNANCADTLAGIVKSTGPLNWTNAMIWGSVVTNGKCGLSDGSAEGDWRLPTKSELWGLIFGTEPVRPGTPHGFTSVQNDFYWSGTTYASDTSDAWYAHTSGVMAYYNDKSNAWYVWPVRDGQ